jgi:hypothetical protein
MKTLLRPLLEDRLTRRQRALAASAGAMLGAAGALILLIAWFPALTQALAH